MRIVAGEHGGRRLVAPAGQATRPTADRVREALFAIIGPVDGLHALDLFAGSGALGLEALSRGAATATFVDDAPSALAAVRRNAAMIDDPDRVRILRADWRDALRRSAREGRRYGLCLLDPPYSLLHRIAGDLGPALAPVLDDRAIVVVEAAAADDAIDLEGLGIGTRTDRVYGGTRISVCRIGCEG